MLQIPQAFYKICLTPCLAKVNLISSKSLPIVPLKGIAGTAARSHQLSLVQAPGMRLNATPHKVVKRHSVATKSWSVRVSLGNASNRLQAAQAFQDVQDFQTELVSVSSDFTHWTCLFIFSISLKWQSDTTACKQIRCWSRLTWPAHTFQLDPNMQKTCVVDHGVCWSLLRRWIKSGKHFTSTSNKDWELLQVE